MNDTIPKFRDVDPKECLAEFMEAAGHDSKDRGLYLNLMIEEAEEIEDAFAHLIKEVADFTYVAHGFMGAGGTSDKIPEAVARRLEFAAHRLEFAAHMLETLNDQNTGAMAEAFRRVHESNMSKAIDGKFVRNEQGKVIKGPNYREPYLLDLVNPYYYPPVSEVV